MDQKINGQNNITQNKSSAQTTNLNMNSNAGDDIAGKPNGQNQKVITPDLNQTETIPPANSLPPLPGSPSLAGESTNTNSANANINYSTQPPSQPQIQAQAELQSQPQAFSQSSSSQAGSGDQAVYDPLAQKELDQIIEAKYPEKEKKKELNIWSLLLFVALGMALAVLGFFIGGFLLPQLG